MIAFAWLATPALAYSWDDAEAPLADDMEFHLCPDGFTPEQARQMMLAARAWHAGEGQVLRGATWAYVRGADRGPGECDAGNGVNEVFAADEDWFADHDSAGALATTKNDDADVDAEVDFVFNTADIAEWTARKPSKTAEGQYSLGMIALHELGHGLGFNHDDTFVAVMNSSYPNGGDLGGGYHPHADDYAGLVANRPGPGTGTNLLLGKFVVEPNDPGDSLEVWNVETPSWTVCRDAVAGPDGPEGIYAAIQETGGPEQVAIAWNLSDDGRCFQGVEYEVGRLDLELGAGVPELIQPDTWDFGAVPAGRYILCATADPDGAVAEIREGDNTVRSEVRVTVQDCP